MFGSFGGRDVAPFLDRPVISGAVGDPLVPIIEMVQMRPKRSHHERLHAPQIDDKRDIGQRIRIACKPVMIFKPGSSYVSWLG